MAESIDNMSIENMLSDINQKLDKKVECDYKNLLTGNVIKKYLFHKLVKQSVCNCNEDKINEGLSKDIIVTRKSVGVEHFSFSDNFKDNFQKYIVEKLISL